AAALAQVEWEAEARREALAWRERLEAAEEGSHESSTFMAPRSDASANAPPEQREETAEAGRAAATADSFDVTEFSSVTAPLEAAAGNDNGSAVRGEEGAGGGSPP